MREKELRLALICYGGVSLAVYMHGSLKEVWRLLRASRAHIDGSEEVDGIEHVYLDLLKVIEDKAALRLRVMCDIVAGSSAGGINGIFFAEAIVTGRSLDPLTDMWLEVADVDRLLSQDARPVNRFSKIWAEPLAWALLRKKAVAIEKTVSAEARAEIADKLSRFVRARWFAPPFGGHEFTRLLFDACEAMGAAPAGPRLLPLSQPLDLFVTVTDFYGHREQLKINSPDEVTETEHRLTIGFNSRKGRDRSLGPSAELIFAARATASFPGAFPPFTVRELDDVLEERGLGWPGRDAFLERILPKQFAAGRAEDTPLIDGSVLANAPFAQAAGALRNRPARREVDRRFVYIDPIPDVPIVNFRRTAQTPEERQSRVPGWFTTILGASSSIPREQPVRDSLEAIERRSERIERMRAITRNLRAETERSVEAMFGRTFLLSRPTPRRLASWRDRAQQKAANAAGYSYAAYGYLKLSGIIDNIVGTLKRTCPDKDPGFFSDVRAALQRELDARGLGHMADAKGMSANPDAIAFFRDHDLRFRVRRMRYLARHFSEEVEMARLIGRDELEAMESAIFEGLALYLERETADFLGEDFGEVAKEADKNPARLLDEIATRRDLAKTDEQVETLFIKGLEQLPPEARRTMLLAYLGFPLLDIATLPLLEGEGLGEFDPIKVDRIAPDDALTLREGGTLAKLKGIEFNLFGAFFSRAYRENDYLWGRLDSAERLIDIVLSSVPVADRPDADEVVMFKKRAFMAVLGEEEERLERVRPLIEQLRNEIEGIS
ncbi:patatin-like protein [Novosphingopyxis sp.]|uniref:patatin-like protein n=1 Tax=Novosphingopyxis sp. TaxID=2709690 RepID=UPI003B5BBB01